MSLPEFPLPEIPSETELGLPDWLLGATEPAADGGTAVLAKLPFDLSGSLDAQPPSVTDLPAVVPASPVDTPPPSPSQRGFTRRVAVVPTTKNGDVTYRLPLAKAVLRPCQNCVVRFRLPDTVTSAKATHRAMLTNGLVLWSLGDVRPGDPRTLVLRFPATAEAPARGLFEIVADTAAQMVLTLTAAAPSSAGVGEPCRLDVTLANAGDAPTPFLIVRLEPDVGPPSELLAEPVGPGETVTRHLEAVATTAGLWSGRITALANGTPLATGQVSFTAVAPTLAAECVVQDTARVDEMVTMRLRVANDSPVTARSVTAALVVPEEVEFVAAGHGGEFDRTTAQVAWFLGDLVPGESREVSVEVMVVALGPAGLHGRIESTNGAAATTTATATLTCEPGERMTHTAFARSLAELDASLAPDQFDEPAGPAERTGQRHILFELGRSTFAVQLTQVREVLRRPTVTPVPFVADWVCGVANVRGDIVSVVDLAALLGVETTEDGAGRRSVVIAEGPEDAVVGLLVDRVVGIRLLAAGEWDMPGEEIEYLLGLTRYRGALVQMLDLNRVLQAAVVGESFASVA